MRMTYFKTALATSMVITSIALPFSVSGASGGALAVVGDEIITRTQIERQAQRAKAGLIRAGIGDKPNAPSDKQLFEQILRRTIEQELLKLAFDHHERLQVPDRLVQKRLNKFIEKNAGGNRDRFTRQLYNQDLTMAELKKKIRRSVAAEIMVNRNVKNKIHIPPSAVRQYYRQNKSKFRRPKKLKLQGIFLEKDGNSDGQDHLIQKAEKIAEKYTSTDTSFAQLARRFSDNKQTAREGGKWPGWLEKKDANSRIWSAVTDLKEGEITRPLRLENGVYLLRVRDIQPAKQRKLDAQLRKKIKQSLRKKRSAELRQEYIQELRNKFYVKIYYDEYS